MVMVAHFGPLQNKNLFVGEQGVTIFFVLSGYLITTNFMREREASGKIDLRRFYIRRFFRLTPSAWTLLATMALFQVASPKELLSCVLLVRNFFESAHAPTTQHFWSLAIEEQFYLVWPWFLLLLSKRQARNLAVIAAAGFALYRFLHPAGAVLHFPFTQFHADALLVGCAFALTPKIPKLSAFAFWVACIAIAFSVHIFPLIVPLGESVLIGWIIHTTALGGIPVAQRILNWKGATQLGAMSYSLYVWQEPFTGFPHSTVLGMIGTLAGLAAVVCLSFYGIERPCIRFGKRLISRRQAVEFTPTQAAVSIEGTVL